MTDLGYITRTIPAYSAVLHETLSLAYPTEWGELVDKLMAHTTFGPRFRRAVVWHLSEMTRDVLSGYQDLAREHLDSALGWVD